MNKNSIAAMLNKIESFIGMNKPTVSVLVYHSISNDNTIVDVTPRQFLEQILFLKKYYKFITLDAVVAHIKGIHKITRPSIALTFDDGYHDLIHAVVPFLKREHVPAAVFVLSCPKEANRKELENDKKLLSLTEIKKMSKRGWTIGCHTATHPKLSNAKINIKHEVIQAKKCLEKNLGIHINYFAYPKGIYSSQIINFVKIANYKAAFAFESGFISPKTNLYAIPRIAVDHTHSIEQFTSLLMN